MIQTSGQSQQRIYEFLRRRTSYSMIELGEKFALKGYVAEIHKTNNKISAVVRDDDDASHSVSLLILSSNSLEANCGCSDRSEMIEQWCPHAVAVFLRAADLGFLSADSGFAPSESFLRMNTSSPREIANVLDEISRVESQTNTYTPTFPRVKIGLEATGDRLGVKVFFDDVPQSSALFDDRYELSGRALDNVLIKVLEEEGNWDEDHSIWYVNSSTEIEIVLGLIEEYQDKYDLVTGKQISMSKTPLECKIQMEWLDAALQLQMFWISPTGEEIPSEGDLIGTGPYWKLIDSVLYRVSARAAKVASIFPYSSSVTITKSKSGPILEVLEAGLFDPEYVLVANPETQPKSATKPPKIRVELSLEEGHHDHFATFLEMTLSLDVEFEYPQPPKNKNIVYLPDRESESAVHEHLKRLGFDIDGSSRLYSANGEIVLDILSKGKEALPANWEITGFSEAISKLKFSSLALNIALSKLSEDLEGSGGNQCECHVSLTLNGANVPISLIFKQASPNNERWIRLDNGSYARVPCGGIEHLKNTLGLLDVNFRLSNTIRCRISVAQAISLSRSDLEFVYVTLDKELGLLSSKLKDFKKIQLIKPTAKFSGKLRPYQAEGLSWLNFLNQFKFGGILADEMGLGKTVQTLALLQVLLKKKGGKSSKKPALIVAPTSVITNWIYECRRFTPDLKTLLLHGPKRREHFDKIESHDIVVTSYALLRMDRHELEQYQFSYLILDEAQNIKNPQASTTKAAKALKADFRLALTGTPTENRPLELWSIFDFLMPGYLGSAEYFKSQIERPILEEGPYANVGRFLINRTKPFILRRVKAEVERDLPPKIETEFHVQMTASQRSLYKDVLDEVRPRVFDAVSKKGVRGASVSILAALLRLRQVCNHPNSIDSLKEAPGFDSGKFAALQELITEALESDRKILLFSQFIEMMSIIKRWLTEQSINHLLLDGATKNRQDLVDRFNSDANVRLFLISLKAGGTGLNLTAADTVIIYDPWWNPAVENQAIDRAHRIGQTKKVTVYRLVTEDSIEQKIMELKGKKSQLVDALVNESSMSPLKLSKNELESIFSIPEES